MEGFKLIGRKLNNRTKNENGRSEKDCGRLWQYFEENKIAEIIPGKISGAVYAVYYDYENDENGFFFYFIGCRVAPDTETPQHLDELHIPEQNYDKVVAKGQMPGCITEAWERIWNADINRKFGFDLEIYDERSHDWENAEIDIYVSVTD